MYCTVLYCPVLCCTVLYCTVLYCTALQCTVLYCALLYCTVLYCPVLCCTILYCTVLYHTILYCVVSQCTVKIFTKGLKFKLRFTHIVEINKTEIEDLKCIQKLYQNTCKLLEHTWLQHILARALSKPHTVRCSTVRSVTGNRTVAFLYRYGAVLLN